MAYKWAENFNVRIRTSWNTRSRCNSFKHMRWIILKSFLKGIRYKKEMKIYCWREIMMMVYKQLCSARKSEIESLNFHTACNGDGLIPKLVLRWFIKIQTPLVWQGHLWTDRCVRIPTAFDVVFLLTFLIQMLKAQQHVKLIILMFGGLHAIPSHKK